MSAVGGRAVVGVAAVYANDDIIAVLRIPLFVPFTIQRPLRLRCVRACRLPFAASHHGWFCSVPALCTVPLPCLYLPLPLFYSSPVLTILPSAVPLPLLYPITLFILFYSVVGLIMTGWWTLPRTVVVTTLSWRLAYRVYEKQY